MAGTSRTTRGLRIASRCANVEQFVSTFQRFCDEHSFFVPTVALRPLGLETAFSLDLADNTPALRGLAVVAGAWSTTDNPFGRPGMQFRIKKLTTASVRVFEQLLAAREASAQAEAPQEADSTEVDATQPDPLPDDGARTPGGELVLPANPLTGIPDASLAGFVECTLYEETGNFFPVDPVPEDPADPVAPPPLLAPLVPRSRNTPSAPIPATELPPPDPMPSPEMHAGPPPMPMPPPIPNPEPYSSPSPYPSPSSYPMSAPPSVPIGFPSRAAGLRRQWASVASFVRARRMLVVLVALASCTFIIAIVALATRSSSAADKPSTPAPTAPPSPRAPPPAVTAPPADDTTEAENATPADPNALPVVGSGPCKLVVTSTPAGSTVSLDGNAAGPTPLAIAGPCALRHVELAHPRYAPATRTVTLAEGKPQTIDVTLQRPTHKLLVTTSPEGATVSIAGRRAGTSPTYIDVMGFSSIAITLDKPGYQSVTKHVYSKVPSDRLVVQLQKTNMWH